MHCKDCKHWRKLDQECRLVDWVQEHTTMTDATFAIYADANDDQGLVAGFKTGPEFGCVRFKKR